MVCFACCFPCVALGCGFANAAGCREMFLLVAVITFTLSMFCAPYCHVSTLHVSATLSNVWYTRIQNTLQMAVFAQTPRTSYCSFHHGVIFQCAFCGLCVFHGNVPCCSLSTSMHVAMDSYPFHHALPPVLTLSSFHPLCTHR